MVTMALWITTCVDAAIRENPAYNVSLPVQCQDVVLDWHVSCIA